ncbi:D-alanyl-D-alanine carboxypeptidase [Pararhodospirillum oryzae]|uniref:Peptidase S11 n=1 Tax=Pararhodospirillum oryzae TaxID=478448 RepID=A0A512HAV6_9PROT|nr:D-alanyl-D-alanine carboxypeptidase [Pararhodospirillum oryzae]GEO82579.1 peptidase S11 [Pararhodospirillum oryzae]
MSYLPLTPAASRRDPPPARAHGGRWPRLAFLALLTLLGVLVGHPGVSHAGYAALVVDAASGKVLYARNADTRNYPASLTKMMTLYLLFETVEQGKLSLASRIPVSARAAGQPPSKLGVSAGSTIRVEDAILALVTRSANDIAVAVAEAVGGSESAFAQRMSAKARALGMVNTTFKNASGLPNSGQTTSARDMVLLALALQRHFPKYYHYFSTTSFRFDGRTITTHNHVLSQYAGADGLKTGYINASGYNVVSSAVRGGQRLVAAVMGGRTARSRDQEMMSLLDKGFATLRQGGAPDAGASSMVVAMARTRGADAQPQGSADDAPLPPPSKPGRAPTSAPTPVFVSSSSPALGISGDRPTQIAMATPLGQAPVPPPLPTSVKASLPTPPALPAKSLSADGSWGVQVGAYSNADAANSSAAGALNALRGRFKPTLAAAVLTHRAASGTLYRARVLGLTSQRDAQAACATLKKANQPCLVVLPSGSSMVPR